MSQQRRWELVEDLFEQALAVDEGDRAAFLTEIRPDDVAAEVRSLVANAVHARTKIGEVVGGAADDLTSANAESLVGQRLGAYRLASVIGEGGMGIVYRARRDDAEFEQDVAIKILSHGLASPRAVARFRDERQILATLDHPAIVRLLDGGSTDRGLPYLVMEHVEGTTITEFARSLDARAKVELVSIVCDALAYAHGKLVVHRDIKPSNILVRGGQPKLLDFGIAKLIDPESSREAKTGTGVALLTPAYASPEQAKGQSVSVASDVYSLGAVLYELLAGRSPHDTSGTALEVLRSICEVEPTRPGCGDLDNVVLKALAKDPAKRYPSIAAFADDLRRFLDGMPVLAREATLGYRARKFVRRNAGKLALAAGVTIALVTATIVSVSSARRADEQAKRAERRFDEVRKLAGSLFDVDRSLRRLPGTTAARELVVSRAVTYLDSLASEAIDNEALALELANGYIAIADILGNIFEPNLGRPDEGQRMLDKAEAILARLGGSGAVVESRRHAAYLRLFLSGLDPATFAKALALETLGPPDDPVLRLRRLLVLDLRAPDLATSERYANEALAFSRTWQSKEHSASSDYWVGVNLSRVAEILVFRGAYAEGVRAMRETLAIYENLVAADPRDHIYGREVTHTRFKLGTLLAGAGDGRLWIATPTPGEEGEGLLRRATEEFSQRAAIDPDDTDSKIGRAAMQASYAIAVDARSHAESLPLFQQALASYDEIPKSVRDENAIREVEFLAHCAMAPALAAAGRRDDAIAAGARGLAIAPSPLLQAMCRSRIGLAYRLLGERDKAIAELEATIALLEPLISPSDRAPELGISEARAWLAELRK